MLAVFRPVRRSACSGPACEDVLGSAAGGRSSVDVGDDFYVTPCIANGYHASMNVAYERGNFGKRVFSLRCWPFKQRSVRFRRFLVPLKTRCF